MTIFLVVFLPLCFMIKACVNSIVPGTIGFNMKVDEDLSNYFEALEHGDKQNMILEEENVRRNYVSKYQINF